MSGGAGKTAQSPSYHLVDPMREQGGEREPGIAAGAAGSTAAQLGSAALNTATSIRQDVVRQFWMVATVREVLEIECKRESFVVSMRLKLWYPDPDFLTEVTLRKGDEVAGTVDECIEKGFATDGTLNKGWDFAGDPGDAHFPFNYHAPFKNVVAADQGIELDWISYHSNYEIVGVQFHKTLSFTAVLDTSKFPFDRHILMMCMNIRQSKVNTADENDRRITRRHRWELCGTQRPAGEVGLELRQGFEVNTYVLPPAKARNSTDQVLKLYDEDMFALGIRHFDPYSSWYMCKPFVDMPGDGLDGDGQKMSWKLSLCLRIVRKSSYHVQDVVFSMFLIVLCTNSIEWMVVEPADRQAAVMASLFAVLALKFTIKESIPEKSVMCTMEWYFFWSLAYHVAFVSFICADDMCARDVAELAAEEGSSSLSQFTLRDEPFCWAYSNTFRVIGDYFMLLVWVVPHAFCMLFSRQLFGCPNILATHDAEMEYYNKWSPAWDEYRKRMRRYYSDNDRFCQMLLTSTDM